MDWFYVAVIAWIPLLVVVGFVAYIAIGSIDGAVKNAREKKAADGQRFTAPSGKQHTATGRVLR